MSLSGTFDCSFVALLANLWAEMEALLGATGADDDGSPGSRRRAELRAQALRLELVLLADHCDSTRWQALCSAAQVARVRVVVCRVLELLDFSPFEQDSPQARSAIVRAQNFLFDEVCRLSQAQPRWTTRTSELAGNEWLQQSPQASTVAAGEGHQGLRA